MYLLLLLILQSPCLLFTVISEEDLNTFRFTLQPLERLVQLM